MDLQEDPLCSLQEPQRERSGERTLSPRMRQLSITPNPDGSPEQGGHGKEAPVLGVKVVSPSESGLGSSQVGWEELSRPERPTMG